MALMNLYTWRRFLRKLEHIKKQYLVFIPVLLMTGDIFYILDIAIGLIPDSYLLYIISSSFVGITFIFFVVAVVYDFTLIASKNVKVDKEKRKTLKLIFDVTMIIAAVAYLLRGFSQGLRFPGVNKQIVKIKDFPVDNYSIVQLSDVHVGRTIKRDFIQKLVETTNELKPDLVVITGDLIDLPVNKIEYDLYPLKQLNAPTYFILGNHEYFHGPGEIISYLKDLEIIPLINGSDVIQLENGSFNLIGMTDLIGMRTGLFSPDVEKAYQNIDQNLPCLVLAHQPKMINEINNKRCDLMLSGHTHGGQIFPFGMLVMTAQPYLAGLYTHRENCQVFVSRGAGYWGPPIRILAPNEISQIVIKSA